MCQEFTNYLKAVGFHIPEGKALDFVPEDGYSSKGWDSFESNATEDFGVEPRKKLWDATPEEWNNAYQNIKVTYK
jgi:hypothetical protein